MNGCRQNESLIKTSQYQLFGLYCEWVPSEFESKQLIKTSQYQLFGLYCEWVPSEFESKQLIKTSQYQLFGLYSEWVPSEFESKQLMKTSQYQLFGLCSEWVPSEFESKQLIKTSQYQLFGLYNEWVPSEWESDKNITISAVWTLQWMGAVRIRIQTDDKNHHNISCLDSFWRHPFTVEHPLLRQPRKTTFLQIWWRKLNGAMFGWNIAKFSTSSMLSLTGIQCSRGEIANSHCGDM